MKILFAITSIDKGGAETHLVNLVDCLVKKNFSISIYYIKEKNAFWKKYLKKLNVSIFKRSTNFKKQTGLISFCLNFFYLRKVILKLDPDIIHVHLPYMELLTFLVLKTIKKKYKLIITKHVDSVFFNSSYTQESSFLGILFGSLIFNRAAKVIAISSAVKKFIIKKYINIDKNNIVKIYYGINKKTFSKSIKDVNQFKKKYNLEGHYVLGVAARLVRQKSLEFLIRGFHKYNNNFNKKSKLLIAGEGPLRKELEKLVEQLNLKKSVIFIGFMDDIKTFYHSIDVFCLISRYEGLGFAILEAMACKKPVVTSNLSAMPEIIKHKKNGFLIDNFSIKQFVIAIHNLRNKSVRNKFSLKSQKILKSFFSLPMMTKKTIMIYKSILK